MFRNLVTIVTSLKKYAWLWIAPSVAFTVFAGFYAALRPTVWSASQGLIVRDEAIGNVGRQGRFESAEALKKAQETVLEMARNPSVVEEALRKVGPATAATKGHQPLLAPNWPTSADIRQLQSAIRVSAPRGVEFGQTELIYLSAQAASRQRAVKLTASVCEQLEKRLQNLRNIKAESVTAELEKNVALAEAGLAAATGRLESMEAEVGSDLAELRSLAISGSSDGNQRLMATQIASELRTAKSTQLDYEKLHEYLLAAKRDPSKIVGMPQQLFTSNPALRKLKDGLVEAQLRTSRLLGSMNEEHPLVNSALAAEKEVRESIREELAIAIHGLEADIRFNAAQIAALQALHKNLQAKLHRLAKLRARYANLTHDVRRQSEILQKAQYELSSAQASRNVADAASLLTWVDDPVVGDWPEGPSGKTIVLSGFGGGLLIGLGLVFLVNTGANGGGRRWTDRFHERRTSQGNPQGRRASDHSPEEFATCQN